MMNPPTNSAIAGEGREQHADDLEVLVDRVGVLLGDLRSGDDLGPVSDDRGEAVRELALADAIDRAHVDGVEEPRPSEELLGRCGVEVRRRGAAEVLLATELDRADDCERLRRAP